MDEEIKKALEELRAQLGKQVDLIARLDKIEAAAATGTETVTVLRRELDTVKGEFEQRGEMIRKLQEQGRTRAAEGDPIRERRQGLEMLGMIVRSELARANRMELPTAFRNETELIRKWNEDLLARATLTPMSTTGSYLVPSMVDANIQDALEEVSPMLGEVDFIPGLPAAGTYSFTFLATRPVMQPKRASTDTAMTASDPVFGQLQISPNETYVFFPVDNKLFLMSAVALGGYFEGLCRQAMADKLGYWLLRADGSATYNSLTGILNESTAAYIHTLPGGKTAFADLSNADLNKMKAKCLKRGRGPRGRWLMDLEIQGVIEDIDRTGKVPVLKEMQDGSFRCKQNEILIEEYMPGLDESAADTGFIGFGDLATYLLAMVGGIQIASDSSVRFDKNQTAFRAVTAMAFGRKPVATFILGKTAAA